jgi:hypothetical protein
MGVLTHDVELRRWMQLWDEQQEMIQANIDRANTYQAMLGEREELRRQLVLSEMELAHAVAARASLDEEVRRLRPLRDQVQEYEQKVADLEARAQEIIEMFQGTMSWRLTAPVRRASDVARRFARHSS